MVSAAQTFQAQALAIAIQSDDKVVAAGKLTLKEVTYMCISRYDNCMLDTSFGSPNGYVTLLIGSYAQANAVIIQTDGKIVIAGYAVIGGATQFAIARFNTDGTLDTTFNSPNGFVTTSIGDGAQIYALLLQPDTNMVTIGSAVINGQPEWALARYTNAGALDAGFGTGGIVTTPVGNTALGTSGVLQPDGKIVVGGSSDSQFAVGRYLNSGILDATFGILGTEITSIGNSAFANAVALQANGRIILAGSSDDNFALARYTTAGILDGTYGLGGIVIDSPGQDAYIWGATMQPDQKVVVGGIANNSFTISRYTAAGLPDAAFNAGAGFITLTLGVESSAQAVALQSTGNIVGAGFANNSFAVVNLLTSGTLNTACGNGGIIMGPGGVNQFGLIGYTAGPTRVAGADISDTNYVYSYCVTNLTVGASPCTFIDISFSNDPLINGWTHTLNTAIFTCNQTGRYLIQYDAIVQKDLNSAISVSLRSVLNGVEIPGTQSTTAFRNGVSFANLPVEVTKNFIVEVASGDQIKFQLASTADNNGTLVANTGCGTVRPSISVTITRIS